MLTLQYLPNPRGSSSPIHARFPVSLAWLQCRHINAFHLIIISPHNTKTTTNNLFITRSHPSILLFGIIIWSATTTTWMHSPHDSSSSSNTIPPHHSTNNKPQSIPHPHHAIGNATIQIHHTFPFLHNNSPICDILLPVTTTPPKYIRNRRRWNTNMKWKPWVPILDRIHEHRILFLYRHDRTCTKRPSRIVTTMPNGRHRLVERMVPVISRGDRTLLCMVTVCVPMIKRRSRTYVLRRRWRMLFPWRRNDDDRCCCCCCCCRLQMKTKTTMEYHRHSMCC